MAAAARRSDVVLAGLLPGVDVGALQTADDGGFVARASPGPGHLETLLGVELFDDLLGHHDQRAPRLRAVKDGRPEPDGLLLHRPGTWAGSAVRVRVGRLVAELTGGTTVALDGIDEIHPAAADLAEHLERAFLAHVLANGYVSSGDRSGTGRHWDDHDVLVLQLEGSKHWSVRQPAEPVPLRQYVGDDREGGDLVFDDVLAAGDCLYLPRGHVHVVTPTGGFSSHVTFGITRPRVVDVLGRVLGQAGHDPAFRRDLGPVDDADWARSLGEDVARSVAATATGARTVAAVGIRSRASTRFSALRHGLIEGRWEDVTARLALPGGLWVDEDDDRRGAAEDEIVLAGGRQRWAVARHALPMLGRLAEGRAVPVLDLATECPSGADCARTLVAQLAVDGAVTVDRADPARGEEPSLL
jgi:hypothetical protein